MAKKKLTMNEMVSRSIARRRAEVCEEAVESEVCRSQEIFQRKFRQD